MVIHTGKTKFFYFNDDEDGAFSIFGGFTILANSREDEEIYMIVHGLPNGSIILPVPLEDGEESEYGLAFSNAEASPDCAILAAMDAGFTNLKKIYLIACYNGIRESTTCDGVEVDCSIDGNTKGAIISSTDDPGWIYVSGNRVIKMLTTFFEYAYIKCDIEIVDRMVVMCWRAMSAILQKYHQAMSRPQLARSKA